MLASHASLLRFIPNRKIPDLLSSETIEALKSTMTSPAGLSLALTPVPTRLYLAPTLNELLTGSFVMTLIVPAIALPPKRAEPPPRTTSIR